MTVPNDAAIRWLLEGDPAVTWQTQRDLLGCATAEYTATRRLIAREGWGARLLAERAPDGTWGGGLYTPKWIPTFYTLQLLSHLGLPEDQGEAIESCRLLLDRGVDGSGDVCLWDSGGADTCVAAMLVSMAHAFGLGRDVRIPRVVARLLAEQMRDGG